MHQNLSSSSGRLDWTIECLSNSSKLIRSSAPEHHLDAWPRSPLTEPPTRLPSQLLQAVSTWTDNAGGGGDSSLLVLFFILSSQKGGQRAAPFESTLLINKESALMSDVCSVCRTTEEICIYLPVKIFSCFSRRLDDCASFILSVFQKSSV